MTEHVAVKDIAGQITREAIVSKLRLLANSLRKDFGIDKPKIAVLGLNPHAGDEGLIGDEEADTYDLQGGDAQRSAVKKSKQEHRRNQKNVATGQIAALGSLSYQWEDDEDRDDENEYDSEADEAMSYLRSVR